MAIGMTYDEYWYGDPLLVRAYYRAEQIRREQRDETAWLHGLYMMNALDAIVGNAFRKESVEPAVYPREPMLMKEKREREARKEQRRAEREEKEKLMALAWMSSFVQAGKNFGKNKIMKG